MGVVGHVFKTAFVYRFIYYDRKKANNSLCFIRVDFRPCIFWSECIACRNVWSRWSVYSFCRDLFLVFAVGGDLLWKAF